MDYQKLLSLPKTELHCHLDGSLSLECIKELLGRDVKLEELQVSDNCKSLGEYLEKFDLPLQGLQTKEGLKKGAKNFLKNLIFENIKYVEIRFAPMLSVNENLTPNDVIESVLEGLNEGKLETGIQYNVIVSLMRHHDEETNLKMVKIAREYLGKGVCAIDLAGNEAIFPTILFKTVFESSRKLDMPFTIHSGECGSVQNVIDAISFGTKRVGHGIALRNNKKAQKYAIENKIGIEMCPISNFQTKAISSIPEYPIKEFLENNLLVTINTDNRMVSNTSLSKEFSFLQENFNISDEDIYKLLTNSIEVSFASKEQKYEFKKML